MTILRFIIYYATHFFLTKVLVTRKPGNNMVKVVNFRETILKRKCKNILYVLPTYVSPVLSESDIYLTGMIK